MCVAIPVELIERNNEQGIGELEGVRMALTLLLVPQARIGDYLLVHAGCALQVIDKAAADETLKCLREISNEADS